MPPAKPRKKVTVKKPVKGKKTRPQKPDGTPTRKTTLQLNVAVQEAICANIRKGMSNASAAVHAGITKDRFYEWLKFGHTKGSMKIYRDFATAIDDAHEKFEAEAVEVVAKYALHPWEAVTRTVETIRDKEGKPTGAVKVVKRTETMIPDLASAKWLLERRRQGFTPMQRIEHSQQDDKPLEIVFIPPPSAKKDKKDGAVDTTKSARSGK